MWISHTKYPINWEIGLCVTGSLFRRAIVCAGELWYTVTGFCSSVRKGKGLGLQRAIARLGGRGQRAARERRRDLPRGGIGLPAGERLRCAGGERLCGADLHHRVDHAWGRQHGQQDPPYLRARHQPRPHRPFKRPLPAHLSGGGPAGGGVRRVGGDPPPGRLPARAAVRRVCADRVFLRPLFRGDARGRGLRGRHWAGDVLCRIRAGTLEGQRRLRQHHRKRRHNDARGGRRGAGTGTEHRQDGHRRAHEPRPGRRDHQRDAGHHGGGLPCRTGPPH